MKQTIVLGLLVAFIAAFSAPVVMGSDSTSCTNNGGGWNGDSSTACSLSCNNDDQVDVTASSSDGDAGVHGSVSCGSISGLSCDGTGWCSTGATTSVGGAGSCEANTNGEWVTPDITASCTSSGGAQPDCASCYRDSGGAEGQVDTPQGGGSGSGSPNAAPSALPPVSHPYVPILGPGDRIPTGLSHVVQINVVGGIATAVSCSVGAPCVAEFVTCAAQNGLTCVAQF